MSTPSIGSYSPDYIISRCTQPATVVDVWSVPGVDGIGAQQMGTRGGEFQLVSVEYFFGYTDNSTSANTTESDCYAMQGTILTVTDNYGTTWENMLVTKVDTAFPGSKKRCVSNGDAKAVRLEIHWQLIPTGS
jgi:hypothetical protein